MKRYELDLPIYLSKARLEEHPDGEWVRYEDAQELYEIVLELSHYKDSPVPNTLIELAEKVAKKARGEGE